MQHLSDLRQYRTALNSIPRLLPEETRQLTSRVAAARQETLSPDLGAQAKRWLIEGHLWLVFTLVKRSGAQLCTLSSLDLVQQGNLGLLRACDRFDFATCGNFTAYASTTIHYTILDALPMENTINVSQHLTWRNHSDERLEALRTLQPLSLDAMHGEEDCAFVDLLVAPPLVLPDTADEAAEEAPQQDRRAQVEALLARLAPREREVLRLRYGLDEADGRCHAPSTIARKLGLDCSTVCRLEQHAVEKLRASQNPQAKQACQPDAQAERRQEQVRRLEAACAELRAQGIPICVRTLARTSHVDKQVIGPFLHAYCGISRAVSRNAWRPPEPNWKPRDFLSRWHGCTAGRTSGAGLPPLS